MDKRTSTGVAGDLGRYTDFSVAEALTRGGSGGGSDGGLAAGIGAGMGMAMAERMARRGPWGEAPGAGAATPPPPPAAEAAWHVAEGGASRGPFSPADLRAMAADGRLTLESWVWTAGSADWRRAGAVPELTGLFHQVPPPPPAG